MIAVLNRLVDFVEDRLTEQIDVAGLASTLGSTVIVNSAPGLSSTWPAANRPTRIFGP